MKRIAVLAVLAALLGTSVAAVAAQPCCDAPDCRQADRQPTSSKSEARSLYEREFNQADLGHRF
jgi:hypothetical protein